MNAANNENQRGNPSSKTICFPLGQLVATPGALDLFDRAGIDATTLLQRHQHGDWGSVSQEDAELNDNAVVSGLRILSSYPVGDERIWIITEADRSSTTLLLPDEY